MVESGPGTPVRVPSAARAQHAPRLYLRAEIKSDDTSHRAGPTRSPFMDRVGRT